MPVRVALVGIGSRGDVQPYIALGQRFVDEGHPTTLVTTQEFAPLARSHGIEVEEVPVSVQAFISNPTTARAIEGGGLIRSFLKFREISASARQATGEAVSRVTAKADVLVVGFGAVALAYAVKSVTGVPVVRAYNVPITSTRAFPGVLFPRLSMRPRSLTHRIGHWLTNQAVWMLAGSGGDGARKRLSPFAPSLLSAADDDPIAYGISRHVLPRPTDWPTGATMDGFWFAREPETWTPPADLEAFIAAGSEPVYVGFGSMASESSQALTRHVVEATQAAGVRVVLHQGWAGLGNGVLPAHVHLVGSVPHSWLFPRMAAIVHHGGAGTTASAFRAGRPQVVVPFHGDQPFWGMVANETGVAPRPLPRRSVTTMSLAHALTEVSGSRHIVRAAEIGRLIATEDGCGTTVNRVLGSITRQPI